jgi:hypothetical protein
MRRNQKAVGGNPDKKSEGQSKSGVEMAAGEENEIQICDGLAKDSNSL